MLLRHVDSGVISEELKKRNASEPLYSVDETRRCNYLPVDTVSQPTRLETQHHDSRTRTYTLNSTTPSEHPHVAIQRSRDRGSSTRCLIVLRRGAKVSPNV